MQQTITGALAPPAAAPAARADAEEARLLAQVAAGDRQAFERLYRGYFHRLARFLGRMTHSAPLIEEIINDTMLVVWRRASSYDGTSKVSTWVFGIAWRKAKKALSMVDEPVESDGGGYPAEEQSPEQHAQAEQLARRLAGAVARLPWPQRLAVVLTYFHGMDYAEIAAIAECPVNTVKTRMFHARRRLKELLAGEEEGR
ncbi:sigma-70 family RNA polymerase sigma factor [Massilia dura]|uniref:Sigma-70 family RNA polymerase sigma factor n=1 Tax=Pseudoduganella dura TaxID=321982 RepID=A0A6I3XH95_9BURK|nr:sigma-70 family RNA polymerase sigma factor [Pseudoduganella dura]MUI15789.1 sigma-70 family RNA polymerase sigma factor [Pseudoduganella dura]GGX89374.1 RNA polymerase sigma factor [Pseudoduganella dura]